MIKAVKSPVKVLVKEPGHAAYYDEVPMDAAVLESTFGGECGLLGLMSDVAMLWLTDGKDRSELRGPECFTNRVCAPNEFNIKFWGVAVYGPVMFVGLNKREYVDDLPAGMLDRERVARLIPGIFTVDSRKCGICGREFVPTRSHSRQICPACTVEQGVNDYQKASDKERERALKGE